MDDLLDVAKELADLAREEQTTGFLGDASLISLDELTVRIHSTLMCAKEQGRLEERQTVADWIIFHGYATGHGDTSVSMLIELEGQIRDHAIREESDRIRKALLAELTKQIDAI